MTLSRSSILFHWDARHFLSGGFLNPAIGGSTFVQSRAGVAQWRFHNGVYVLAPVDDPRGDWRDVYGITQPTYLLEPGVTNVALRSNEPSDAAWVKTNMTATAFAAKTLFEDEEAMTVASTTAASSNRLTQTIGTLGSATQALSIICEEGDSTKFSIGLYDAGAAGFVMVTDYTWATDVLDNQLSGQATGTVSFYREILSIEPKIVRVTCVGTATNSGNSRQIRFFPQGRSRAVAENTIWHHCQLEVEDFSTSPIVTAGSSVSRVADGAAYWEGGIVPQGLIAFLAFVYGGVPRGGDLGLLRFGDPATSTDPFLRLVKEDDTGDLRVEHDNGTDAEVGVTANGATPTPGGTVEAAVILNANGSVRVVSVVGTTATGSSTSSTPASGLPGAAAFDSITIGSIGNGAQPGADNYAALNIVKIGDVVTSTSGGDDEGLMEELRTFAYRVRPSGGLVEIGF